MLGRQVREGGQVQDIRHGRRRADTHVHLRRRPQPGSPRVLPPVLQARKRHFRQQGGAQEGGLLVRGVPVCDKVRQFQRFYFAIVFLL